MSSQRTALYAYTSLADSVAKIVQGFDRDTDAEKTNSDCRLILNWRKIMQNRHGRVVIYDYSVQRFGQRSHRPILRQLPWYLAYRRPRDLYNHHRVMSHTENCRLNSEWS